jgi:hypothetical protein
MDKDRITGAANGGGASVEDCVRLRAAVGALGGPSASGRRVPAAAAAGLVRARAHQAVRVKLLVSLATVAVAALARFGLARARHRRAGARGGRTAPAA